jgi:DNA-directed RNA polymerase specialized sigma24 family protein
MMSDPSPQPRQQKKDWVMTQAALARLLEWLDEGNDSGGKRFLEMRRRLVSYFDRKNCLEADDLADETLNRIARRLEEETIESETPAKYCYIVARFVFMEHLRAASKASSLTAELEVRRASRPSAEDADQKEKMLDCLEGCTAKLELKHREIIRRYYIGKERLKIENRQALAKELGITMNALSIRACRIRDKLEACVRDCMDRL